MPVLVKKEQAEVGKIEHAEMVVHDDTDWRDKSTEANVRVCQIDEGRNKLLANHLKIGDAVKDDKKNQLVELLLQLGNAFALTDEDL